MNNLEKKTKFLVKRPPDFNDYNWISADALPVEETNPNSISGIQVIKEGTDVIYLTNQFNAENAASAKRFEENGYQVVVLNVNDFARILLSL